MKRGQVTVFIILAVVIMLAFGFMFFLQEFFLDAGINQQADQVLAEYTQRVNLNTLVQSCIRTNTRTALWKLGMQGGRLYESDRGSQTKPKTATIQERDEFGTIKELELSYWIENNTHNPPFLCYLYGPNSPNSRHSGRVSTCLISYSYSNTLDNIQSSIAGYINNTVSSCIDIDNLITTKGNEVIAGNPKTEVIMSEESIIVVLEYPFTISIKGKQPEIKVVNFSYSEPIRLQKLYNLAWEVSGNMKSNPSYIPENSFTNAYYYSGGLVLQRINNFRNLTGNCEGNDCFDDLIWIKDDFSTLYGEPYVLQFAVE